MHNSATFLNTLLLMPFAFWLLTMSCLFWQFFGGKRDPIYHELTANANELNLCTYIKLISLLEFFQVALNHVHEAFALDGIIVENQCNRIVHFVLITKLIAAICILALHILFLAFENMLKFSSCMFWQRRRNNFSNATSTQQIYNNSFESQQ